MTGSKDQPGRLLRFPEVERPTLYETIGGVLQDVLARRFDLSQSEAELLVRDTFLLFESREDEQPEPQAWLIGTACRKARDYQQRRALTARDEADEMRDVARILSHRAAAEMLPSRAREAIRLRFLEHKTYQEIADELDISRDTATRIVAKAMVKIRQLLRNGRLR